MRYRPNLPPVLRGVSISIKPTEKLGVVGRTGDGKSSLINTLLRVVEPGRGRILIDACNISEFGVRDLRMVLGIIPSHRFCFQGGENFSVGQRQLLSLSRALLRRSKILVLDEATAAVDVGTDALIQKTIREEFKTCTMIIIAHRMNTIIDSDRILVLDAGKVLEVDTPANLV
ncbi:unnamed protein product [Calypogeia fissa]